MISHSQIAHLEERNKHLEDLIRRPREKARKPRPRRLENHPKSLTTLLLHVGPSSFLIWRVTVIGVSASSWVPPSFHPPPSRPRSFRSKYDEAPSLYKTLRWFPVAFWISLSSLIQHNKSSMTWPSPSYPVFSFTASFSPSYLQPYQTTCPLPNMLCYFHAFLLLPIQHPLPRMLSLSSLCPLTLVPTLQTYLAAQALLDQNALSAGIISYSFWDSQAPTPE
ncbi:unnamed protein product [Gulo gulo]|uniref:Uncharacterized protein n=1 Tax=Gulo gulo TaxID=48420 RepID=A0A9X9LTS0_GULGU|nr:unnamed protein product [Gulo gulo]